jgi:predicted metal-dependent enzyme (double-stranded beta helix superfamily)
VTDSAVIPTLLSPAKLTQIAMRAASRSQDWLGLVQYDTSRRWYQRLAHDDEHEVWLLSWLPGQGTGFHDHGASAGAFAVAIGELTERSAPGGRPAAAGRALRRWATRSFGPDYVHDVSNESAKPAVSIHAYSPPLVSMRRYEVTGSGLLQASTELKSW